MFTFPEPPPIDYYVTDISPTYVADGVFYHGRAAATHKYIAKQLNPIKRTLRDPIAPLQELDSRDLNRLLKKENGGYVDPAGRDDGMVFDTLRTMPKWDRKRQSLYSIFPRSLQYELSYIHDRQLRDSAKCETTITKCTHEAEKTVETEKEPCHFLEVPTWWKGESGKPKSLPVGNIDDYAFERVKDLDQRDAKISEKLHMDHPRKYIPGVIHRIKNPDDTSMKDVLERADAFKVVLKTVETLPKEGSPVDNECINTPAKSVHGSKLRQDSQTDATPRDQDRRWQPLWDGIYCSGTDAQRRQELHKLTKSFLHELHTWYSKNKPTKLRTTIRHTGKRPIPERCFSHL